MKKRTERKQVKKKYNRVKTGHKQRHVRERKLEKINQNKERKKNKLLKLVYLYALRLDMLMCL
jgi:hypothetical protein